MGLLEIVQQMICEETGERPDKCHQLVAKQAAGLTQTVWWAKSLDGREWVLFLTPDECGLAGAYDCVEVMMVEIPDRSALPENLRRAFGLDR